VSLRALHLLDSQAGDPEAECARFRRLIAASGGLDLVVLGVGPNGHLAFNEPGSPFDSVARRVALAATTRETYAPLFGAEGPPEYGLTLGVADLLAARRVLLLAFGRTKAGVVARALERPMTEELPASALQRHPQATVLLDREAASALRGQS
jgi:glucosamine-6-phosphate deaminase